MRRLTLALGGLLAAAATTLVTAPAATAQETGSVYVVHGIPNTRSTCTSTAPVPSTTSHRARAQARSTCRRAHARSPSSRPTPPTVGLAPALGEPRGARRGQRHARGAPGRERQADRDPVRQRRFPGAGRAGAGRRHEVRPLRRSTSSWWLPRGDGLTNPNEEALEVPRARSRRRSRRPDHRSGVGPADLDCSRDAMFAHVIGSLQDNTLGLVVVTVDGLDSSPSGVPCGHPRALCSSPVPGRPVLAAGAGRRRGRLGVPARPALTCVARADGAGRRRRAGRRRGDVVADRGGVSPAPVPAVVPRRADRARVVGAVAAPPAGLTGTGRQPSRPRYGSAPLRLRARRRRRSDERGRRPRPRTCVPSAGTASVPGPGRRRAQRCCLTCRRPRPGTRRFCGAR